MMITSIYGFVKNVDPAGDDYSDQQQVGALPDGSMDSNNLEDSLSESNRNVTFTIAGR
jgi:hypothetical protein